MGLSLGKREDSFGGYHNTEVSELCMEKYVKYSGDSYCSALEVNPRISRGNCSTEADE